ncbi:RelB-like antitoxin [Gordonia phage Asapag]|uniref:Ribbon-helix-helix DNA binding protein n=1 Tax=Gordonia phage Asapag TaxID=2507862 RepID=A0A410TDY0_9CAUD|nr:RelB-like antitoxin [Gordonia phage Asapag]QAU07229.1 ribbon-helix-helix DNA binding protein [Gordonia phage Asapag]
MSDVVRLSINLTPDVADKLKSVANIKGITLTDAANIAISLLHFTETEKAQGHKIAVVQNVNGVDKIHEVKTP